MKPQKEFDSTRITNNNSREERLHLEPSGALLVLSHCNPAVQGCRVPLCEWSQPPLITLGGALALCANMSCKCWGKKNPWEWTCDTARCTPAWNGRAAAAGQPMNWVSSREASARSDQLRRPVASFREFTHPERLFLFSAKQLPTNSKGFLTWCSWWHLVKPRSSSLQLSVPPCPPSRLSEKILPPTHPQCWVEAMIVSVQCKTKA